MSCIFCKIVNRNASAEIVFENDETIAFKDIHPLAPVHILIIPKRHIGSIIDITKGDVELVGKLILAAKKIADNLAISEKGYKLLFRVGPHGGQVVEHIHLHLIGGAKLREDFRPI